MWTGEEDEFSAQERRLRMLVVHHRLAARSRTPNAAWSGFGCMTQVIDSIVNIKGKQALRQWKVTHCCLTLRSRPSKEPGTI